MALPNKLNGFTYSVTSCMVHPSLPCCITHQELESQESAVSPVVRCTVLHLRWLHFWWFAYQFLEASGTVLVIDAFWYWTVQSSPVSSAKQWLHTVPKLESVLWTSGGSALQDVSFQLVNLESGWMFVLEWKVWVQGRHMQVEITTNFRNLWNAFIFRIFCLEAIWNILFIVFSVIL